MALALLHVFVAAAFPPPPGKSGLTERAPWVVAFTFGLLHGLGFAGALSEVGLPQQAIPWALLFFNVGVELGQLAFVLTVLGLIAIAHRLPLRAPPWGWRVVPHAIGVVAMFWVIERITAFERVMKTALTAIGIRRRAHVRRLAQETRPPATRIGELQFTHDFANGYPTKETVEMLYDERDFQRACQAYLWSIPAVSFAQWQSGQASFGAGNGDIAAILSYDDRLGILTPNATTPYYIVFDDLSTGPVVIDMPPNVRGGLSDGWQRALPNTTQSAKYLVLGPGQEAPTDVAGFEVRRCPTFNMFVGIRITATDPKEAAALLAQFRAYPYAQRGNPPAPKIVGPQGKAVERHASARHGVLATAQ